MKTLAIIAAVLVGLYLIGSSNEPAATAAIPAAAAPDVPSQKVEVIGIECISHRTGTDLKGSLRNISSEPLKFVKIYASFDGRPFDGFINELTLQPGNISTFLIPGPSGHADKCGILYVQDRDGHRIN